MRIPVLALVVLTVAGSALAATPEAPSPRFEGKDLFGLQWAADPQIRPDGSTVAYVRKTYEVMTDQARASIWLIDVATGKQSPLITGPGSHSSPRWSPDGTRLAYVSSAEGRSQLYVRWVDKGVSSRIADLTDSPDSLT